MIKRMILGLLLVMVAGVATANEALKRHLDQYPGTWEGVFTAKVPALDYEESFQVEQKYWWDGAVLRGVSVARRETGIESSTSSSVIDGDKILSKVTKNGTEQVFYGTLVDGGLLWFPANLERANDYQIKESFAEVDGELVFTTTGFDTLNNNGEPAILTYEGAFVMKQSAK